MNNKNKPRLYFAIAVIIIGVAIVALARCQSSESRFREKLENVKTENQKKFDSLSRKLNAENAFHDHVLTLIKTKQLDIADKLVDSAIKKNSRYDMFYTYKGMIDAARNNHSSAIQQFTQSMALSNEYPLALAERAKSFIQINAFENAIIDLRKAADMNYEYTYDLGKAYEKMSMIDSAVTYYEKYLEYFPEKKEVRQHISSLTSRRK